MELSPVAQALVGTPLLDVLCESLEAGVLIVEDDPESAPSGFRVIASNAKVSQLAGLSPGRGSLGVDLGALFPDATDRALLHAAREAQQAMRSVDPPPAYRPGRPGGGWYRARITPLDPGKLVLVFSRLTDASDRPPPLRSSHANLAMLAESMVDGLFDWDLELDTLYLSPSWKAQLGYADDEIRDRPAAWIERIHPEDRSRVLESLGDFQARRAGGWEVEYRVRHKRGHYLWARGRAMAVRDRVTGKARRLLGAQTDITDRHLMRERQRLFVAVAHAIPDLLLLVDHDGTVVEYFAPPGSPELTRAPESALNVPIEDVLPADLAVLHKRKVLEALGSGSMISYRYGITVAGRDRFYEARLRASGASGLVAIVVRDVTGEQEAARELQARLRRQAALQQVFRISRSAAEPREMVAQTAAAMVEAPYDSSEMFCRISLADLRAVSGNPSLTGPSLGAAIFDGATAAGTIKLRLARGLTPTPEDQRLLNAVAEVLGMALRRERATRTLQMYRRVTENTRDGVALLTRDMVYALCNEAYAEHLGRTADQITGQLLGAVLPRLEGEPVEERLRRVLEGENLHVREWRTASGRPRLMDISYWPFRKSGVINGVIVNVHDATELYEAQAGLRRAASVFESAAEAIIATDAKLQISDINAAFTRVTGYSSDQAMGRPLTILGPGLLDRHSRAGILESLASTGRWTGELALRRREGTDYPCRMTISTVDREDVAKGYVAVFTDITAQKQHEQQLERLASQDSLTGLHNRGHFLRILERALERADRDSSMLSLMFIDLDRFKEINDTLGHDAGDEVLRTVARRLVEQLRASDVVARQGGDEFVALLPGVADGDWIILLAEKILAALRAPIPVGKTACAVSGSIGISSYPEDARNAIDLLRLADRAMYRAKAAHGDSWCRAGDPAGPEPPAPPGHER